MPAGVPGMGDTDMALSWTLPQGMFQKVVGGKQEGGNLGKPGLWKRHLLCELPVSLCSGAGLSHSSLFII